MNGDGTRVWQSLTLYENTDLVRDLYKRKHDRSMNTAKAWEVSSHFAQGREYYQSAAGAGDLVPPLILFYGTMALSRGLVLFLDTYKSQVAGGHGLSEGGWTALDKHPERLPEAEVKVDERGTFLELCQATQNAEVCEIATEAFPKSVVRAKYAGTDPVPPGSATTIKEIVAQIPDLHDLYEETFDELSLCLPCDVTADPNFDKKNPGGSGWVSVYETRKGIPDPAWVGEKMGREDFKVRRVESASPFARSPEIREKPGFSYPQVYKEDPGTGVAEGYDVVRAKGTGRYFLKLPAEGFTTSNIVALYLVAFATGTLVRYHPGYWMSVVSRGRGGSAAPILSAAVSVVEEQFPGLVLERLR